jgi:hypothetical protein
VSTNLDPREQIPHARVVNPPGAIPDATNALRERAVPPRRPGGWPACA